VSNCRSTNSNVVTHIARCAPEELTADHAAMEMYRKAAKAWIANKHSVASGSGGSMAGFLAPVVDFPMELALMCLADSRPFRLVEGAGFLKFIESFAPKVRLCSADTVAREAVLIDEALQRIVTRELLPRSLGHSALEDVAIPPDTPFALFSATSDTWTSASGEPFLGLTIHFINSDWKLIDLSLALRHFPPPHTAEQYEELFGAILEENNLLEDHLLTTSADSASTMICFADLSEFVHTRCIAHSLHNGIKTDTFDKKGTLDAPVKLARFFSAIATTRNKIAADTAAAMGVPLVKAVLPVATRWNSSLACLRAHNKRFDVIRSIDVKKLPFSEAGKAKEYKEAIAVCLSNAATFVALEELLQPVEEWSARLQASLTPTVPLLFEARASILAKLAADDTDTDAVAAIRAALRENLTVRLNDDFVPTRYPSGAHLTDDDRRLQVCPDRGSLFRSCIVTLPPPLYFRAHLRSVGRWPTLPRC